MAHILVFDSGVGGLSVSAEIRRLLPNVRQTYVADDVFRPYGEKTQTQLKSRLPGLLRTLEIMLEPDVIVIACNTASTAALADIREYVTAPVVGVVPAIKPAAQNSQTKTIAVLGTPGTVKGQYVNRLIQRFASDCQVIRHGSTPLVDYAEAKLAGEALDISDIKAELSPIFDQAKSNPVDHIVLACTHFPLLKSELEAVAPYPVQFIDSGEAIARRVKSLLVEIDQSHQSTELGNPAFVIGAQPSPVKTQAFSKFGFKPLISLPDQ